MCKVSKNLVVALIFMGALGSVGVQAAATQAVVVEKLLYPNSPNFIAGSATPLSLKIGKIAMLLGKTKCKTLPEGGFNDYNNAQYIIGKIPSGSTSTGTAKRVKNFAVMSYSSQGGMVVPVLVQTDGSLWFIGTKGVPVDAEIDLSPIIFTVEMADQSSLLPANGWVDFGGPFYYGPGAYKQGEVCVLGGLIKPPTPITSTTMVSTLSVGNTSFKPKSDKAFMTNYDAKAWSVKVLADGTGSIIYDRSAGTPDWISLNGIHYTTDDSTSPFDFIKAVYNMTDISTFIASASNDNLAYAKEFLTKAKELVTSGERAAIQTKLDAIIARQNLEGAATVAVGASDNVPELEALKALCLLADPYLPEDFTALIGQIDAKIALLNSVKTFTDAVTAAADAGALKKVLDDNTTKAATFLDKGGVAAKLAGFLTTANVATSTDKAGLEALGTLYTAADPFIAADITAAQKTIADRVAVLASVTTAKTAIVEAAKATTATDLVKALTDNAANAAVVKADATASAAVVESVKTMAVNVTTLADLDALIAKAKDFVTPDLAVDAKVVEVKSVLTLADTVGKTGDDIASLTTALTGVDAAVKTAVTTTYTGKPCAESVRKPLATKMSALLTKYGFTFTIAQ